MGTRSATGVRIDGQDKLTYNQFDGYPSGVGEDIVDELKADIERQGGVDQAVSRWRDLARAMRLVDEREPATAEDIDRYVRSADRRVSSGSLYDWYVLLREHQGSILKRLEAGVAIDSNAFIKNSLFCEWAYIINLDEDCLEVYEGFQKSPHDKGRYAAEPPNENGYYACVLIGRIPLRPSGEEAGDDVMHVEDLEDRVESWRPDEDEDDGDG